VKGREKKETEKDIPPSRKGKGLFFYSEGKKKKGERVRDRGWLGKEIVVFLDA